MKVKTKGELKLQIQKLKEENQKLKTLLPLERDIIKQLCEEFGIKVVKKIDKNAFDEYIITEYNLEDLWACAREPYYEDIEKMIEGEDETLL